ncbi:hypothetical protein [Stenotrophobium rhamnosiphilum]|uniref:DUF4398 domain-containing protein n=1 Tax=Stenotrophobium rhamnosiphilum TaxID=2029166 RepID=A0A2T5MEY7_9GAMM|nr:hypothetical protein [Stenotrophobium rhamnosiphilum]PTU31134.1 hypothetical protein CJD38_12660 [Stenotrophobium rhamnosiphilum]
MYGLNKHIVVIISAGVLSLGLSACGGPDTPAKNQEDVTKAAVEGAKDVEKERANVVENLNDAQKDVNKADAEYGHEAAKGNLDLAIAEAEAAHKVTIERCEALAGDARTLCKKQADATLEQAKVQAKITKYATDPKQ